MAVLNRNPALKKQRGVALLVVMMIMALMTTVAISMSSRLFVNFNRVDSQLRYQQAYWYATAVESLARVGLEQSFDDSDVVTLNQPWAVRDQTYPLDGGLARGSVYDKQACFNLNGLVTAKQEENGSNPHLVKALQQLLESQEVDSFEAETIAASMWEFVDTDTNVQSVLGVEDSHYESLAPAYVTANGPIADVSEWRAINGVTKEIYQKTEPWLCALPNNDVKVNVNTLTEEDAPLLAAIFHPTLNNDQAREAIGKRPFDGWADINSFLAEPVLSSVTDKDKNIIKRYLDVRSRYFELDATIEVEPATLRLRALLQRSDDGKVTVVRRRFGGVSERNTDNTAQQ